MLVGYFIQDSSLSCLRFFKYQSICLPLPVYHLIHIIFKTIFWCFFIYYFCQVLIWVIRISRYLAELLMIIKQNVTKYINGNIDASIDLTPKKHFLQEISLLNLSKTYCESVVKKTIRRNSWQHIIWSGTLWWNWKFKRSDISNLLNNEYSYHSHCNKVLKLKESRIKNRTLDFTIKEECCSAPKQKFTCLKMQIKN